MKGDSVGVKKPRASAKRLSEMGERWIRAREFTKLTQAELAKKLGVTGSYISLIESGKRVPDVLVIVDAAKLMNVELRTLCP